MPDVGFFMATPDPDKLGWVEHRWPGGYGYGHPMFLSCNEWCEPEENRMTTYHHEAPPLSWETSDA
jgi:hypothetical protein